MIHILLSVVYVGPFSETKLQIVDSPLYDKYPTSLFTGMKEIFEGTVSLLYPPLYLSEDVSMMRKLAMMTYAHPSQPSLTIRGHDPRMRVECHVTHL